MGVWGNRIRIGGLGGFIGALKALKALGARIFAPRFVLRHDLFLALALHHSFSLQLQEF